MTILGNIVGELGALSKLTIKYEQRQRGVFEDHNKIVALFNPNQLRYDNRAEWRAAGTISQSIAGGFQRMEFQATPPTTLSVDLFFDTYEGTPLLGSGGLLDAVLPDLPLTPDVVAAVDVTTYTSKVANLARVAAELHRPPVCKLEWGKTTLFVGVLTQLRQDLTFFMPDGTPVRATLGCTFMAYRTFDVAAKDVELHSSDVAKRRVVRRGDTLTSIAIEEYSDAARWRDIARDNDIDDPRSVAPGQVLVLPKVVT